ncbi:hypothetical protein ABU614_06945 [Lysobacter firmicutimachus]|uniref:Uncharacterized protein n=1 Tax=Lysobacter firmicutimachus TaxID=1792846 RepID=A0AAU8MWD1_9GAMM
MDVRQFWLMQQLTFRNACALAFITCATAPMAAYAAGCADTEPYYWQGGRRLAVYDKLVPLMTCRDYGNSVEQAMADATACNWFVGRALHTGFGVIDFTPEGDGWKSANEIAAHVATSSDWILLGSASEQAVLNDAGEAASAGRPVIAVASGNPHGHVALILGGPLSASGGWGGRMVPNSASLFIHKPASGYVGCKLSYAFAAPMGIKIYKRL